MITEWHPPGPSEIVLLKSVLLQTSYVKKVKYISHSIQEMNRSEKCNSLETSLSSGQNTHISH